MKFFSQTLKNKKTYFYLLLFFIFFLISSNMHYNADEFNYSHITWSKTRISSISDILYSQKILYMNWTGRVIIHSLIQLVLYLGNYTFPILNSIIFCSFIFLISNLFNKDTDISLTLIAMCVCWTCLPVLGETAIWISGSINYLWPSTLFLLFIYLFKQKEVQIPLLMILAFLSGASHEMIFISGSLFLLLDLFITKTKFKDILIYSSFLLGSAFLLLAPGNFLRANTSTSNLFSLRIIFSISIGLLLFVFLLLTNIKFKDTFFKFLNKLSNTLFIKLITYTCLFLFIPILILYNLNTLPSNSIMLILYNLRNLLLLGLLFVLLLLENIRINTNKNIILNSINLFILGIISYFAMRIMPEFPDRSKFFSYTYIIISIIILASNISVKRRFILFSTPLLLTALTLSLTLKFYLLDLNTWNDTFNLQLSKYESSDVAVIPIQPTPPLSASDKYAANIFTEDPNSVINFYGARYYNLNKFVGVKANSITIQVKINTLEDSQVYLEYSNENGIIEKRYPLPSPSIESSNEDLDSSYIYFSLPSSATNINLSNPDIPKENISIFSLN